MSGFNAIPLGQLVSAVGTWNPDREHHEGTFTYIDLSSIDQEQKVIGDARDIPCREAPSRARQIVSTGDVLVSTVRPNLNGVAIVPDKFNGATASTGFCVLRAIPKKLDNRYLFHWVKSKDFVAEMVRKATGASYPAVSDRIIHESTIPLPPLNEQRRIATILDKAEDLRAKRRETIAKLDSLEQSIFLDMFGDPVTNPKGWPLRKFNELGSIERGVSKHRPRNAPELLGGPHPFVQTGDVANCDGYVRQYSGTYSDAGLKQSRLWQAGTLCITIAANIAKTGILTFDACFPDSVVGFQAKSTCAVQYVRIWLSFLQKALEDSAPESAQKNINLEILRNLNVPVPPVELQEKLHLRLIELDRNKRLQEASEKKLDELFSALQRISYSV